MVTTAQNGIGPTRPSTEPLVAGDRTRAQLRYGSKGLAIWGGILNEEYLTELSSWSRRVRAYLEMQDDPVIATLLDAIKAPLLKAEFTVEAASDAAPDVAAAAFVKANMDGMEKQTWRSHALDMLEMLDFGFAIGEVIMEPRDGRMMVTNIEPRGQETLYRWIVEGDRVTHMEQGDFRGGEIGRRIQVPLWKCVHAKFRGRKGNPEGRSLLRSLYQPWRYTKNFQVFEGIGIERDVGGMPVFTEPEQPMSADDKVTLDKQLAGIRMDEQAFARIPFGAELAPYQGGQKAYNIREVIGAYQRLILMRFFAQFLTLGMDRAGTQALVEGSQDFFTLALEDVQHELLEEWNSQLVPLIMQFNAFPGMTGLPKIEWQTPGRKNVEALVTLYGQAVTSGGLVPQPGDEAVIREALELPPPDPRAAGGAGAPQWPFAGLFGPGPGKGQEPPANGDGPENEEDAGKKPGQRDPSNDDAQAKAGFAR